jgi:hypothetical protein
MHLLPKVEGRDMHSLAYFGFVKKKQAVLREVLQFFTTLFISN